MCGRNVSHPTPAPFFASKASKLERPSKARLPVAFPLKGRGVASRPEKNDKEVTTFHPRGNNNTYPTPAPPLQGSAVASRPEKSLRNLSLDNLKQISCVPLVASERSSSGEISSGATQPYRCWHRQISAISCVPSVASGKPITFISCVPSVASGKPITAGQK